MTARAANAFYRVGDIIALFIQMGCQHNIAEENQIDLDGDVCGVSYLLEPGNGAFVALVDLDADDQISEIEVASWERRLGIEIPRPR